MLVSNLTLLYSDMTAHSSSEKNIAKSYLGGAVLYIRKFCSMKREMLYHTVWSAIPYNGKCCTIQQEVLFHTMWSTDHSMESALPYVVNAVPYNGKCWSIQWKVLYHAMGSGRTVKCKSAPPYNVQCCFIYCSVPNNGKCCFKWCSVPNNVLCCFIQCEVLLNTVCCTIHWAMHATQASFPGPALIYIAWQNMGLKFG